MPSIVANTFTTFDAKGNREDLADIIYDVSPTKTPGVSNAKRGKATATLTQWQMDRLDSAVDNPRLQGQVAAPPAITPTTLVGNYTQIAGKEIIISGTQQAINPAGRAREVGYQLARKGLALRRDMERIMFGTNKGGVGGNATTPPELASLPAWLKSNTVFQNGDGGADPTWTSGVPGAGRTDDGTPVPFTETMLKECARLVHTSGGDPSTLMVGPYNKQVVSGFDGISQLTYNLNRPGDSVAIIGGADVYKTDYGVLTVVPNRFQRERDAFLLDWDLIEVAYLRPFFQEELAKTGDAEMWHLLVEFTLKVLNEEGLGGIYDLTESGS